MATVEIAVKGGLKLQKALQEIAKRSETANAVKVGFMAGSTYPDGTPVAMVAAIQNFGAPAAGIPKRPFFSDMVRKQSPKWGASLANILKNEKYDAYKSLKAMGEGIGSQLQSAIIHTDSPPLSPVTVMLRGMRSKGVEITGKTVGEAARRVAEGKSNYGASTKVLDDTAHMLNSVHYAVNGDEYAVSEKG